MGGFTVLHLRSSTIFNLSTEQRPLLDVSGGPAPSNRTPRGSALGGQIIPQLSLEELPGTRMLKYSKRMEPLQPIERHLHVVKPSQAVLIQLTPNQRQDDLSELPKYKFQMRGSSAGTKSSASVSKSHSPSMLERRMSGRHIVELAAAQTRQQELAMNESRGQDVDRDDANGPIKQHPPPFDEGLEKQHSYEFVKRGASAKSVVVGSGRPASRGAASRSVTSRPWIDGPGLDGLVMLGPEQPSGQLWGTGTTNQSGTALSNQRSLCNGNNSSDLEAPDSRHGSAASVHVRSARGKYTPTESHSVPYVPATSKHNFIVPPSTSDYVQVKPKEKTSLLSSSNQHRATPQQQTFHSQGKAKPLSLHGAAASQHISGLDGVNRSTPSTPHPSDYNGTESDQKLIQEEMTSTMQSITEITESLLDPSQRASLSPTTGNFVEHFVKKTEAEISDIAAELQQQLHSVQQEDRSLAADSSSPSADVDFERNVNRNPAPAGSSDAAGGATYAAGPAIVPKKATKLVETEHGQSTVVTTYGGTQSAANKLAGGHDVSAGRAAARRQDAPSREFFDRERTMTTVGNSSRVCRGSNPRPPEWLVDPEIALVSLASVSGPAPGARPYSGGRQPRLRAATTEDGHRTTANSSNHRDNVTRLSTDAAAVDVAMDDAASCRADLNHSSGTTKRMASSPTKISLMISRGHQREHSASGNQFHAYPLTRQPRPPVLRSMPKRR